MTDLAEELHPREEESRSPLGGLYGVMTGFVANNEDPDRMGRVRVRLPWLGVPRSGGQGRDEQARTGWLPVMTWMGGDATGVSYIPELDDMVLVAFEHGELNHGFVLGVVRNSQQPPPYDNADGGNHTRVIRSRSGHELRFVDNQDERSEQVSLTSSAGHELTLDDSQGSTLVRLRTSGGQEICLDDASGQMKIKVSDGQGNEVTLDATAGVSIKAAVKLTLDAPTIEINGSTQVTLTGGQIRLN